MMNKKIKRTLCGLVASLCLVGSTVPVFAETVDFDSRYQEISFLRELLNLIRNRGFM